MHFYSFRNFQQIRTINSPLSFIITCNCFFLIFIHSFCRTDQYTNTSKTYIIEFFLLIIRIMYFQLNIESVLYSIMEKFKRTLNILIMFQWKYPIKRSLYSYQKINHSINGSLIKKSFIISMLVSLILMEISAM